MTRRDVNRAAFAAVVIIVSVVPLGALLAQFVPVAA